MTEEVASSIRSGILFTKNPVLGDLVRQKVSHWPIDISVREAWTDWKDLPGDCRLVLFDRSTIGPVEISDPCFRMILSGEATDLLLAIEEFFFLRDPLASAVGIEPLLKAKCRQYLEAMSSLRDSDSAYVFFCSLLDRMLIPSVLELTDGNQHKAARILGISRTTFRSKMKRLESEGESSKGDIV
jgi:DNA-binding protein Fis